MASTETGPEPSGNLDPAATGPRPAAVSFITTEHFTLQGARAATIAEATAEPPCSSAQSLEA